MTISELSVASQKRNLWEKCKKLYDDSKMVDGAMVFAKQSGYAPWPSTILHFNKSRSSAVVRYFGFEYFVGTVKRKEIVQMDEKSKDAIGSLILFTLKTKSIKEYDRFLKAVKEIRIFMDFSLDEGNE